MAMRSRSGKNPNFRNSSSAPPPRSGPQRQINARLTSAKRESKKDSKKMNRCLRLLLAVLATLVVMLVFALLMPGNIDPVAFVLPPPPSFTGSLAENGALKEVDRMFDFLIRGPESIAIHEDSIFTGTLNGKIMKVDRRGRMTVFLTLGEVNCSSFLSCGRPFGMRIDPTNRFLFVADGYFGLFKVDLRTAKPEKVFPFSKDFRVTFFNDFDFLPNGDVVLSEASTRFPFHQMASEIMESRASGRLLLISSNERHKRFQTLRDGLHFANGVQVDLRDGGRESVLVAESTRFRVVRVFVNGSRRGQTEVFADGLPGMPDNIRATEAGDGYWLPMALVRRDAGWRDRLAFWPKVRSALAKVIPAPLIFHFGRTRYGLVLRLDLEGRIVSSLHDASGEVVRDVSQVTEHAGALYLGNYDSTYIGRLDQSCKERSTCRFRADKEAKADAEKEGKKKTEL